jgi:hypothetical protein
MAVPLVGPLSRELGYRFGSDSRAALRALESGIGQRITLVDGVLARFLKKCLGCCPADCRLCTWRRCYLPVYSSLIACRQQTLAAMSPPRGASQNAWVYICPQTINSMYQIVGMHLLSASVCQGDNHHRAGRPGVCAVPAVGAPPSQA